MPLLPKAGLLLLAAAAGAARAFDIRDLYSGAVKGDLIYAGHSNSQNGRCGLGPPSPAGIPQHIRGIQGTVGVSSDMYAFSACAVCVRVFLPTGGTEDYYINDECTACAWSELNVGSDGEGRRSGLSWMAIPCDVGDNPVEYLFQGSHNYYLKIQPRTTRCPVGMVALKNKDGQWVDGVPTPDYFYTWQASSAPFIFPITIRITSIFGEQKELGAISETPVAGSRRAQFGGCGAPAQAAPPAPPAQPAPPAVPPATPAVDTTPPAPTTTTTSPSVPVAAPNATEPPSPPTQAPPVTITEQPHAPAAASGSDPAAPVLKNQTTVNVVNNGTHEITSTCTTIVRDMSQSPRNPAPKQGKGKAAVVADAADAAGGAKQEAAVTVAAPAGGAGADPAAAQRADPQGDAGTTPLNRDWPIVESDQDVHVWSEGTNEITKTCTTVIRKVPS